MNNSHKTSLLALIATLTGCPDPRVDCMDSGCLDTESTDDETFGSDSGDGDGDDETGDGDGDTTSGEGDGDGEPVSPCDFPLEPCPNDDCEVDGRRNLSDMDCGLGGCSGLWSGTDHWSPLLTVDILEMSPPIDPSTIWECEPNPDVDLCTDIDANGLVECYRIDGEYAIAVQPSCVSDGTSVDAGNGMCSGNGEFAWPCASDATITCDSLNRCWAEKDGWPNEAQWADPVDVQNGVDSGTLTPVDLGLAAECYTLDGADYHPCVVNVDCTPLLGMPAVEIELTESDCASTGGPWSWVGESATGTCWGLVGELVVRLRLPN
jgi:hypothetical protein